MSGGRRVPWWWCLLGLGAGGACVVVVAWWCCFHPLTTALVVRHAEKVDQSADPPLSAAGQTRATALAHVAGDAGVSVLFVTELQRTHQTVEPLRLVRSLPVVQVAKADVDGLVARILHEHAGEVVLVAGHSDTVPQIVARLGAGTVPAIGDGEFDNLYVVTVYRFGRARVVRLKYGEPT